MLLLAAWVTMADVLQQANDRDLFPLQVSFATFLTANLLPVTLGNIVGGAVCIALAYAVCFGNMGRSLP